MELNQSSKSRPLKTERMRKLEMEQGRLLEHLEETQAVIRDLKRTSRETQLRLRQLNGEIAVESFKQPVLRLVHDSSRQEPMSQRLEQGSAYAG